MIPSNLNRATPQMILSECNASDEKQRAAEILSSIGMPTKKYEQYRYFDIESLLNRDWVIAPKDYDRDIEKSSKVIITDGVVTAMPDDVDIVVGCSSAIDLSPSHFDPLYYFSHIAGGDIISIRIKSDKKLDIVHKITKNGALIPYRVAIYVDSNISAQIFESFEAEVLDSLLICGIDMFVSRDSRVKLYKDQTLNNSKGYTPLLSYRFKVDSNAELNFGSFDLGSGNGLQTIDASLHENATIDSKHLLYAGDNAQRGTVSRFVHIGKYSKSNQIAKNILDNRARGIFDALIKVENSGKYTKAHQNSKAILLNSGAYMASKPQLEIYIDDLEASHGSTTGQLDEAQLFYLRSRGISYEEAKKMLILAFANELIDSIDDEIIRDRLHTSFDRAYYGDTKIECMETCHGCEDNILS